MEEMFKSAHENAHEKEKKGFIAELEKAFDELRSLGKRGDA